MRTPSPSGVKQRPKPDHQQGWSCSQTLHSLRDSLQKPWARRAGRPSLLLQPRRQAAHNQVQPATELTAQATVSLQLEGLRRRRWHSTAVRWARNASFHGSSPSRKVRDDRGEGQPPEPWMTCEEPAEASEQRTDKL